MNGIRRRALLAVLVTLIAAPAFGHSTGELADLLGDRERFFQAFDRDVPDFALSDAEGELHTPADFRGKVVVLHFVYASCPDVCPLHAEKLAEVQGMVNQTPMRDLVAFVSVTSDPANDTAEVMRAYGPAHGLDPVNWTFLTAAPDQPEDTTRRLAEAFGHKFKVTEEGAQVHGVVTHVMDRSGRWRANFHGLRFEPANMALFLNALTNDAARLHGRGDPGLWERVKGLFD